MDKNKIKKILAEARINGYAIPHFNFAGFFELLAIMEAAAELKAPVFVASLPPVAKTYDVDVLSLMVKKLRERTGCTAMLHLDHSNDVELCLRAVDAGYDSVMIDASSLSLDGNIAEVSKVVEYASARGCIVEGEIGRIKGRGDEGNFDGDDYLVQPDDAFALARDSGVDMLAVGIGTAHGFYKGEPQINFKRLSEVASKVSIPLVMHGGTGIPEKDVRKCIKEGITKVNVGTIIRYTYQKALKEEIEHRGAETPPLDIMVPAVTDKVKQVIKEWIITCMADNTAI